MHFVTSQRFRVIPRGHPYAAVCNGTLQRHIIDVDLALPRMRIGLDIGARDLQRQIAESHIRENLRQRNVFHMGGEHNLMEPNDPTTWCNTLPKERRHH